MTRKTHQISRFQNCINLETLSKIVSFRLLVVVNGIAAAYSLLQAVRCVVGMMKGTVLINKPLALAIFSGDQVIDSVFTQSNLSLMFPLCSCLVGSTINSLKVLSLV